VQYAGETRTIPLVQRPEDLEYRLVSFIRDLTRESELTIGIVEDAAAGQATGGGGVNTVRQALGESYQVETVNLETDPLGVDLFTTLVLVGSPFTLADSVIQKVADYLQTGGSALIMASGMQMPPQPGQPFAQTVPVVWNQILEPYGLSIRGDLVYDLASNEQASVQSRIPGMRLFVNYPFWLRALSTRMTTVNQELETVFLPWTSQIDTAAALPGSVTPLFVTSNAGGFEEGQAMIMPQRPAEDYRQDDLRSRLVAVMVNPLAVDAEDVEAAGDSIEAPPRGRLIVVGNGDFARDNWVRNAAMNVIFVLNAVDWLAQDEALISIRSKNRAPPALVFESTTLRDFVKYLNVAGVPILIILVGAVRLWRRKQATRRVYQPLVRSEAS
ncbi:MAG: Gldg family protein, partial [Gemmatimonadota bacterium]